DAHLVPRPAQLDDLELPPVRERPRLGFLAAAPPVCRLPARVVVDEEDATGRCERSTHERPELVEPLLRNGGEPEGEESEVEPLGRFELEDVGPDELCLGGVEGERLRVRVDGDDAIRQLDELARPDPRARSELEHASARFERLESCLDLGYV